MATKYCDWATGDDSTGDGTAGNPYKTITKASTGLTGGDEVRVARTAAGTVLTGTLTFTDGDATVTGSGTNFDPEVTANGFIQGADGTWLRVASVTDDTNLELAAAYVGTTAAGVVSYYLPRLTGTLAFTKGSKTVTGTSTNFDTEITIGDFIQGGDGQWYEVITRTSDTSCALYQNYAGENCSGVISCNLPVTSTGQAATNATVVQAISASGTSLASPLVISGGWDLTTQARTGETFFRQMHGKFATRNGYGLFADTKSYWSIAHLSFLRYRYGIYISSGINNTVNTPTCNSNSSSGIYFNSSSNNTVNTPTCNSNSTYGIYFGGSSNNTVNTPTCNSNNSGIYFGGSSINNTVNTPTCNSNSTYGIYISNSSNNTVNTPTCNSNSAYGIYISNSSNNTVNTPTCNSNNSGIYFGGSSGINNTVNTPTCNSNSSSGIYFNSSSNNTVNTPTCDSNSTGIYFSSSSNNTVNTPTCNSNSTYGILTEWALSNIINSYAGSGNGADVSVVQAKHYSELPCLKGQHFLSAGANQCWYEYGITSMDTGTPHTAGTQCARFAATSEVYYISQSYYFKAPSGVAQTLSAWVRASAAYRAAATKDVQMAIYFNGVKISGWTDITPNADDTYQLKSINAAAVDVNEDGILELRVKVRGTAGYVYVADLAAVNT